MLPDCGLRNVALASSTGTVPPIPIISSDDHDAIPSPVSENLFCHIKLFVGGFLGGATGLGDAGG